MSGYYFCFFWLSENRENQQANLISELFWKTENLIKTSSEKHQIFDKGKLQKTPSKCHKGLILQTRNATYSDATTCHARGSQAGSGAVWLWPFLQREVLALHMRRYLPKSRGYLGKVMEAPGLTSMVTAQVTLEGLQHKAGTTVCRRYDVLQCLMTQTAAKQNIFSCETVSIAAISVPAYCMSS